MEFEFDPDKSAGNLEKHGIDFRQAQKIWDDTFRVVVPAKGLTEQRFMVIGAIEKQMWSAIVTYRGGRVRIISVRRSRENEIEIYQS